MQLLVLEREVISNVLREIVSGEVSCAPSEGLTTKMSLLSEGSLPQSQLPEAYTAPL